MKLKHLLIYTVSIALSAFFSLWYAQNQSIRLDESQSLWVSTKPLSTVIQLTAKDVHVPLYNVLLHFHLQIFGTNIFTARILSYVFFIASLIGLYKLARAVSNQRVTLLTLVLYVFSPFIVWYTTEARMYTLLALATVWNQFYFVQFLQHKAKSHKFFWFISAVIGLYTHYFFSLILISQFLYLLVLRIRDKQKQLFIKGISVLTLAYLCLAPWIWYFISQGAAANTKPLIPPPSAYNIISLFISFLFGFPNEIVQAILVSLWPLLLGVIFFLFTGRRNIKLQHGEYFLKTVIFSISAVFLASMIRPLFLSRYFILITPSVLLLLAVLINSFPKIAARSSFVVIVLSMWFMLIQQNLSEQTLVREDYQGVSNYLSQRVGPKDLVVISAPFTIYPIEYNYHGSARLVTIPEWNRFSSQVPYYQQQTMQQQIKSYDGRYEKVFVVLSYDQGYEKDILAYLSNNYHQLDQKNFNPQIQINTYKFKY